MRALQTRFVISHLLVHAMHSSVNYLLQQRLFVSSAFFVVEKHCFAVGDLLNILSV